jgi:hypothetical protein
MVTAPINSIAAVTTAVNLQLLSLALPSLALIRVPKSRVCLFSKADRLFLPSQA